MKLAQNLRLFSVIVALALLCFLPATKAETNTLSPSSKVAEVNGTPLTREDLDREILRTFKLEPSRLTEKELHEVRKRLLERLIERELLVQAAKESGFSPADEEVKKLVGEAKQGLYSEAGYLRELSEAGLDEKALTVGVRDDLAIKRWLEKNVFSGVQVSEESVRAAFDANKEKLIIPEEIKARNIFFKFPEEADADSIEAVLEKARQTRMEALKPRADFAKLARKFSEGPNRAKGGDLGYFTANQMPEMFSTPVFKLPVGQVSDLIRTDKGVHIVLVEEKRGGAAADFEAVKNKLSEELLTDARQKALAKKLEELRKKGKVIVYLN